ncbi:hypothetical protein BC826DRAFT_127436 [Russula brevipes]|nr:hypothetical protein BC826DRAFT_127436 [Russula brevipes]
MMGIQSYEGKEHRYIDYPPAHFAGATTDSDYYCDNCSSTLSELYQTLGAADIMDMTDDQRNDLLQMDSRQICCGVCQFVLHAQCHPSVHAATRRPSAMPPPNLKCTEESCRTDFPRHSSQRWVRQGEQVRKRGRGYCLVVAMGKDAVLHESDASCMDLRRFWCSI